MKNVILSLFDLTGVMVEPWIKAGYTAYIIDIQHPKGLTKIIDSLYKIGVDLRNGWDIPGCIKEDIVFVSAFPECTNVAVSGARHFLKKGPRALALSLDLFATSRDVGEQSKAPYFIENPVSTFSTYCGKPDYIFNPYDYGGYLPENDIHPRWPEYIEARDSYPKKTCLWTGGGFVMPDKIQVEVKSGYSNQHKKLGGKSQRTKNIRSETPRGFANAVFLSNRGKI